MALCWALLIFSLVIVVVGGGMTSKVAVTVSAELIVSLQAPVPEQPPPDQPASFDPEAGFAVSVTAVPDEKS